jgi:hypothetical protein
VTLYILEGAFTLELEGRAPVTIKAGEAMVEPPNVKMTGYNRSTLNRCGLSPSMSVIRTRLSLIRSTRRAGYGRVEICMSASGPSASF